jgi:hypothetical protein
MWPHSGEPNFDKMEVGEFLRQIHQGSWVIWFANYAFGGTLEVLVIRLNSAEQNTNAQIKLML